MQKSSHVILANLNNDKEKQNEILNILNLCNSQEEKVSAIKLYCERNFRRSLSGQLEKSVINNVLKTTSWNDVLDNIIIEKDNRI